MAILAKTLMTKMQQDNSQFYVNLQQKQVLQEQQRAPSPPVNLKIDSGTIFLILRSTPVIILKTAMHIDIVDVVLEINIIKGILILLKIKKGLVSYTTTTCCCMLPLHNYKKN